MSVEFLPVGDRSVGIDATTVCERDGCDRTDGVQCVTQTGRESRVLCRACKKEYLGVSS